MMNDNLMTSSEVCEYLGISVTMLNKLEKTGVLKPVRRIQTNHKRLYSHDDVEVYKFTTEEV